MSDKPTVAFEGCIALYETEKALLVRFDTGPKETWIPLSQIDDDSEVWKRGDEGRLVITEWIATEKGLV